MRRGDEKLTRLDKRSLQHVREEGEDRVERRKVLLLSGVAGDFAVLNSGEEFSEDGQIQDEWRGEEGVLRKEKGILDSRENA